MIAVFGLRMSNLEHYGQPPTYSHQAKYILVSEAYEDLDARVPTEIRLMANPRLVLRQMIDCAKDLIKETPERTEWLKQVATAKEAARKKRVEMVEGVRERQAHQSAFSGPGGRGFSG